MRRLLAAAAIVGMFSLASGFPAFAGYDYEEDLDRFEGTRTASFRGKKGTDCELLASSKGSLLGCTFIHSTESSYNYPSIMFFKSSEGWDLLNFKNSTPDEIPVILTYSNGVVNRRRLPALLKTSSLRGATVMEAVVLKLSSIKDDLPRIEKIETRYGASEFLWIIDTELVEKSLDFVKN